MIMKTIREVLKWAEGLAREVGKEDSAVKLLLMHVMDKESYEILEGMDNALADHEVETFHRYVRQYVEDDIPVQHIMGYETFFGRKFKVNDDVLIPRFETEELVEKVLHAYDEEFDGAAVSVVDVGCGSGAIGVTLALEETGMDVMLTDISDKALAVAKENARNLEAKTEFFQSDMLTELIDKELKFDILVSNPPYIPLVEEVDPLVFDNEPHLALFGGEDGLKFYRQILADAHKILKPKSIIAFEHAYNHREGMAQLVQEHFPHSTFETIKDMNGKDRITMIVNH